MMNLLLAALIALIAQISPSLQGVVLKAETNEPILNATVELRRTDGDNNRTYKLTTAKDGRFEFGQIPAGQYELTATRAGFVKATYGERRTAGPGIPLVLPRDIQINLQLVMTPTGTISGRILAYSQAKNPA